MRMPILAAVLAIAAPASAQTNDRGPLTAGPGNAVPGATGPGGQPPATIVAEPVAMMIAACDADGDARVTHAELQACLKRSFAAVDRAGAGSIGYIGYSDWALLWLGDRNALPSPFTIDTDGDNRITLAELTAQFDSLFARFDANKDGAATRAELVTIRSVAIGTPPAEPGGKRGAKPKRR